MYKLLFAIIFLFIKSEDLVIFKLASIAIFCVIIWEEFILKKTINLFRKPFLILLILILFIVIGIWTSKRLELTLVFNLFKTVALLAFFIAFMSRASNSKNSSFLSFLKYTYIPIFIFVSLNLFLLFLGIKQTEYEIGKAMILSYLGINADRVEFFLTTGINGYGAFVGILLILSLIGLFIIKKYRLWLFLPGLAVSLITLLFTDSRGPIIYSLLIFLLIKFVYSPTSKPKLLWLIPLIGFIGPLLLLVVLTFLAGTQYADLISRSSEDLATGNARSIIWAMSYNEFLSFKTQHIFGYGEFGQHTAGLSPRWAFVFGDREGAEFMHPHNTLLSIALDYGYVGLALFTYIQYSIVNAIKVCWNSDRFVAYMLLGNILYFNLVGIGETMFGFYYQNILYVFFMINIFAFILKYKNIQYRKNLNKTNNANQTNRTVGTAGI